MKRARGTIVWLFGPNGAGKTRLADQLGQHDRLGAITTFNGMDPATWPDGGTYAAELAAAGVDPSDRDYRHNAEKIARCYDLAGSLVTPGGVVLIDSCPRGEALLTRGAEAEAQELYSSGRVILEQAEWLRDIILRTEGSPREVQHIGLHVTLPNFGTPAARGGVLMDRLAEAGETPAFGPQTAAAAGGLILAGNVLETVLRSNDEPMIRVESMGSLPYVWDVEREIMEYIPPEA
jgi:hypothetical protein